MRSGDALITAVHAHNKIHLCFCSLSRLFGIQKTLIFTLTLFKGVTFLKFDRRLQYYGREFFFNDISDEDDY